MHNPWWDLHPLIVWKILHLIGVSMILVSLGGSIVLGAAGEVNHSRWRKLAGLTVLIGWVGTFMGGFGFLGRLDASWPWLWWASVKILIWFLLGFMILLSQRVRKSHSYLWWGSLLLAALAVSLVSLKPV